MQQPTNELFNNGLQEPDSSCQYQATDPCNPGGPGNSAVTITVSAFTLLLLTALTLLL